jgi:hypothetical protein
MEIWSNMLLCGWRLSFDILSQPFAHMYALGRSFVSPIDKSWGWKSGCIYLPDGFARIPPSQLGVILST